MVKKQSLVAKTSVIVVLIILSVACNNKESARVYIKAPEYSNRKLIIEEQRVAGKKLIDTLYLSSKGKLSYKFDLKQANFYNFHIYDGKKIFLLLKPEDLVNITINGEKIEIEGSEESQKLNYLYDSLFVVRSILKEIQQNYDLSINTAYRDSLAKEYLSVSKKHYKFSINFVLENLASLTSVAALYQELSPNEFVFNKKKDLQFFKLVSDSLLKYYPKHRHVLALKRNFNSMLSRYKVDKLIKSANLIQDQLPEIELPDTKGQMQKLSEVKKTYVLLNFWSPNDQISSDLFPSINSIYKNYNKKDFTIYNVFLGKSLDTWKRILTYEEIESWINVADTNFINSDVLNTYNIKSLPSNYLIDLQTNTILAKNINASKLNQKLLILLNK